MPNSIKYNAVGERAGLCGKVMARRGHSIPFPPWGGAGRASESAGRGVSGGHSDRGGGNPSGSFRAKQARNLSPVVKRMRIRLLIRRKIFE
jgi:hypothetical protein